MGVGDGCVLGFWHFSQSVGGKRRQHIGAMPAHDLTSTPNNYTQQSGFLGNVPAGVLM